MCACAEGKIFPSLFFSFLEAKKLGWARAFVYMGESAQLKGRFSIRESSVALGAACR